MRTSAVCVCVGWQVAPIKSQWDTQTNGKTRVAAWLLTRCGYRNRVQSNEEYLELGRVYLYDGETHTHCKV